MKSNTACVELSAPAEKEVAVSARLLRALSHIIRGDLSVVTNDLSYLSTIAPSEECMRPRARCESAAATLAKVNIITSGVFLESVWLVDVVRELGSGVDVDPVKLQADVSKLSWIGQTLRTLLGPLTFQGATPESEGYVGIKWLASRPLGHSRGGCFASISEYAGHELRERDVIDAALLDLVFQSFGWKQSIEASTDSITLCLTVQRSDARDKR